MAGSDFSLPKARPNGPPFFSRNQIAAALHQVAVLLELQGANVLQLPEIVIEGDKDKIIVKATDSKNSTSNNYKVEVGDTIADFRFILKSENMKMLQHGYDVTISAKRMVEFSSSEDNIKYWVTAEHGSVYDGE